MTTASTPTEEFRTFLQERYKVPTILLDAAKEASQLPEIAAVEKYAQEENTPFPTLGVLLSTMLFHHCVNHNENPPPDYIGRSILAGALVEMSPSLRGDLSDISETLIANGTPSRELLVPASLTLDNVGSVFLSAAASVYLMFLHRGYGEPEAYKKALRTLEPVAQGFKGTAELGALMTDPEAKEKLRSAFSRFFFDVGKVLGKHSSVTLDNPTLRVAVGEFLGTAISQSLSSQKMYAMEALQEGLDSARATKEVH